LITSVLKFYVHRLLFLIFCTECLSASIVYTFPDWSDWRYKRESEHCQLTQADCCLWSDTWGDSQQLHWSHWLLFISLGI